MWNNAYIIGISSGITVSLLLYLARKIILVLLSHIAGIFTRNLSGDWHTEFSGEKGNSGTETVKLYQFLHLIWGKITFVKNKVPRNYTFRGSIRENIIVATYEIDSSKSIIDRGAFTLVLDHGGARMVGRYSWTDDKNHEPISGKYIWSKTR